MADLVLATLNARYAHTAFGLRCLYANLGPLQACCSLREWEVSARSIDVVEALLAESPRVVGFGVYIWNVAALTAVVADLKRLAPEVVVVLGGPEVSHEAEGQPIVALADHVLQGEADRAFAQLAARLLAGERVAEKIIDCGLPDLSTLASPYPHYSDLDLRQRVIYVEASRGCPFRCEFCLSSLELPVRAFPLEPFLAEIDALLARGARSFKFVDRTFNLNLAVSGRILDFFLERAPLGLDLHFEMIPDRLPVALRERIARFPPGSVQLEVGVQTLDPATTQRISRRQDLDRMADNFAFLREESGAHVHADLIVGLPGEDLATFGAGFDRLWAMGPQEIQVGILKRLRGTPIIRHDAAFGMVYSASPPYEVLSTGALPFDELARLRRFARYWDLVANSGQWRRTLPLLLGLAPFARFLAFSDWLWATTGATHQIALPRLGELLHRHLAAEGLGAPAAAALWEDYTGPGRHDVPGWLAALLPERRRPDKGQTMAAAAARRQDRHRA